MDNYDGTNKPTVLRIG